MRKRFLFVVCIAFALPLGVQGEPPPLSTFHRSTLLQQFDRDNNGRLDAEEKQSIQKAFGGVEVPALPKSPFNYSSADLPSYIDRKKLQEADNTPTDNPITDWGATLGRVLFYDTQLSKTNTVACASCHLQRLGFSDPRRLSVGHQGGRTQRNAMSLANLRYTNFQRHQPGFFWDERAPTLEAQVLMPIQDAVEMGMTLDELERKLQKLPYYPPLFQAAFGSPQIRRDRIAKAVAQFMRSMTSFGAKFDEAASKHQGDLSDDFANFTELENLGKSVFFNGVDGVAEHGCAVCHAPPTFSMLKALNNGLQLKYKDRGLGALDRPLNDPFTPSNDGKFKSSSLRNIELTAPYMHDGRFKSLEQVIDHYSQGVHPHPNLALAFEGQEAVETTSGLKFTARQKEGLMAFLKTLTDRRFTTDARFSDPFIRTSPRQK